MKSANYRKISKYSQTELKWEKMKMAILNLHKWEETKSSRREKKTLNLKSNFDEIKKSHTQL
jgi:hypothetical protein